MKFNKSEARQRRHFRLRAKIKGTALRPRLNIYKSNTNFYAQIIDDEAGTTLVSASTLSHLPSDKANLGAAIKMGEEIAKKALAHNITEVIFDRGGYQYHGKVKAFAEAARQAGLKF